MAAPAGTKFYTYQPNAKNVPVVKAGHPLANNQLVLKPGETTGYQAAATGGGPGGFFAIPAPAAPIAPSSTSAAGHWNIPDYASMIPGDWEVTDAEAQGRQTTGEAESAFQKSLREAFIDYGGDAAKLGDYSKYIDQPTIDAAQANKFSVTAKNLAASTKFLRQAQAQQAARGMLGSGATTQASQEALTARDAADYSAMRDFLGGAEQGMSGLAGMRAEVANRISQARAAAAARLAAQMPATWEQDPFAAPPVPGLPAPAPQPGQDFTAGMAQYQRAAAPVIAAPKIDWAAAMGAYQRAAAPPPPKKSPYFYGGGR